MTERREIHPDVENIDVTSWIDFDLARKAISSFRSFSNRSTISWLNARLALEISSNFRVEGLLRSNLKSVSGIGEIWIEDFGRKLNVIFITDNVFNETLHPILDFRYKLEDKFKFLSFNFEFNPPDLRERQIHNRVKRIV